MNHWTYSMVPRESRFHALGKDTFGVCRCRLPESGG